MILPPYTHVESSKPHSQAWTFHIVTFGCKVNQYESQSLREAWQRLGGIEVQDAAQAQVTLVNSCAITARAVRENRNALYRLARENPKGLRILTGCSATLVDAKVEATLLHALVPAPQKYVLLQGPWPLVQQGGPNTSIAPAGLPAPVYPPFSIAAYRRARPVLKVQDGCSHRCTYCIVPLVRGGACSRPAQAVVDEARRLLQAGHCEIMISGINLAQYTNTENIVAQESRAGTKKSSDFWALLRLLESELAPEWAGRARFRISSLEPGQLHAEGLDTLAACSMLCPHLHISLQSGSPAILRRMGRGHYSPLALVEALRLLQQHWPHMGLGADILMGFPGEEPEHVAETLAIVHSLPLTYAHVFPYSRRPGTPAADFPLQVAHHEKLQRSAQVRAAVQTKHQDFLQKMLQLPLSQLILDGANTHKGVNEYYVQCHLKGSNTRTGIVPVRPVGIDADALLVESIEQQGSNNMGAEKPHGSSSPMSV